MHRPQRCRRHRPARQRALDGVGLVQHAEDERADAGMDLAELAVSLLEALAKGIFAADRRARLDEGGPERGVGQLFAE